MINHTNRLIMCSVLLVGAFALTGCGKSSPPKDAVRNAVAVVLPSFLSIDSIEIEPIATGPESYKINFKAVLATKENLYLVDREVEGTPRVTLLKVAQAAGSKVSIYGFLEARRMMDKWMLDTPVIQVGLDQFGKPRGAFNAQSYVTGSDEANAALRQQTVNAEIQEQARKAALDRQERERLEQEKREEERRKLQEERQAREDTARKERERLARIEAEKQRQKEMEQQKKDEEAKRQPIIQATAIGTGYIGTIETPIYQRTQRLRLVFTKQTGFLVSVEVSNPDKPSQKETYSGRLDFDPQATYSILLSTGGVSSELKLRLTDTGLEGTATMDWPPSSLLQGHKIRLQREGLQRR